MHTPSPGNTILFWLMMWLGAAMLAPCLILPAWFDYQAAREVHAARQAQIEQLQARLTTLEKQNSFRDDPAYLARLEQQEFGVLPPGAQTFHLDPARLEETEQALRRASAGEREQDPSGELAERVNAIVNRYPIAQAFVRAEVRPVMMALGGGTILLALLLLFRHEAIAGATGEPGQSTTRR